MLLELKMRRDPELDLDGDFTHPNGSVFSIPQLLDAIAATRRLTSIQKMYIHIHKMYNGKPVSRATR